MNCGVAVPPFESEFEYDALWGGPDPVLWLSAAWQPNRGNTFAADLMSKRLGTWAGSTAQRNVVTDRGRAWTFNGTDDYLGVAKTFAYPFTISAWFWLDATGSNQDIVAIVPAAGTGDAFRLNVMDTEGDKLVAVARDGGESYALSSIAVTAQAWHHAVGVFQSATSRTIYLDGGNSGTDVTSKNPVGMTKTTIGAWYSDAFYNQLNGYILSCCGWPTALTPSQIRLLYESSLDGPGVMARPIGPRWFPAAVAGGVTLVVQDSECIVESETLALTQHHTLAVAGSECIVESDTVALTQNHVLAVGGAVCDVASEQPALTQHHVLAVAASECLVESEGPGLIQHQVLVVQDSASLVESGTVALTQNHALTVGGSESLVTSESLALTQHHVLAVAGSECVVESDNVTLATYELQLVVQDSESLVTSESPSLTQHHVLVVGDAECLVVSEEPTLLLRELLVLADLVCLVVSESPVLTLHYTSPSVIRRGPSAEDTQLRRGPSSAGQPLRRGPGSTDGTIRRPNES